jgi:hypothetical protein
MGRMPDWQPVLPPPPHVDTGLRRRRTDADDAPEATHAVSDFGELGMPDRIAGLVRLMRYLERHADEWVAQAGQEVQLDLRRAMALADSPQARRPH